jgi:hypothetical protein
MYYQRLVMVRREGKEEKKSAYNLNILARGACG